MVKALVHADVAADAAAAVKAKLTSMGLEEVSQLLAARGLSIGKSKIAMVEALLAHEADVWKQLKAYEATRAHVAAKEKDAMHSKALTDLKDLCTEKGIASGRAKEECIDRLAEAALQNGEFDALTTKSLRDARRQSLDSIDKTDLVKLCE